MSYTVSPANTDSITLNETDTVASVLQNISIILQTMQGTVPMHRNFGLSTKFIDKPIPVAKPMLAIAAKEAIEEFEPRASVTNITFTEDAAFPGKLIPIVEVEINT